MTGMTVTSQLWRNAFCLNPRQFHNQTVWQLHSPYFNENRKLAVFYFFDRLVAYPISTAVSKTICLNSSLISLAPFKPLETVLTDTPRRFAISLIVAKSYPLCYNYSILPLLYRIEFLFSSSLLRDFKKVSKQNEKKLVILHKKTNIKT